MTLKKLYFCVFLCAIQEIHAAYFTKDDVELLSEKSPLFNAISNDDLIRVTTVLKEKTSNGKNQGNFTKELAYAFRDTKNSSKIVKLLIKSTKPEHIIAHDRHSRSLIHDAVYVNISEEVLFQMFNMGLKPYHYDEHNKSHIELTMNAFYNKWKTLKTIERRNLKKNLKLALDASIVTFPGTDADFELI